MCKKVILFFTAALMLAAVTPSWADIIQDDFNGPARDFLANPPENGGTIWSGKVGNWPTANLETARYIVVNGPNAPGSLFLAVPASEQTQWTDPPSDGWTRGPLLYKFVKSNYWIMQVQYVGGNQVNWNLGGLMVRAHFDPAATGAIKDDAGPGEDYELFGQFRSPGLGGPSNFNTWRNSVTEGVRTVDEGAAGTRNYVRITQDLNSKGDPQYWFDSSNDQINWTRQASPWLRPDFKGLELELGMGMAQYASNDANQIFDNFWILYQGTGQAWPLNPGYQSIDVDLLPTLLWVPGYAQPVNGHKVYISKVKADVDGRTVAAITTTDPCYPITTRLSTGTTYYWAIDEVNGATTTAGDTWSFRTQFAIASPPIVPENEAGGVLTSLASVSWKPFKYADSQKIYLSKTFQDVNGPGVGGANLSAAATSYSGFTKPLDVQTDYYWRVDTNVMGVFSRGPIWKFTTAFPMNFTDNFNTLHDYLMDGVAGTIWNGIIGPSISTLQTTASGTLRIESSGYWTGQYGQDTFLYKEVDGPYIATVEVNDITGLKTPDHDGANWGQQAGLMARLPDLRMGAYGYERNFVASEEDWVHITFYPTWGVGNMLNVQGWYFRKSTTQGPGNGRQERGRMYTAWPENPNPNGLPNLANASGRFLMIDYKGHGNGLTDDGKAGRFFLRWSQNGSTWFNLNTGDNSTSGGRNIDLAPLNRYGDMNGYVHQIGIATDNQGGFAEFDNFTLGRELQAKATGASPPIGGSMDIMKTIIQWTPGDLALNQKLYFGTSEAQVQAADEANSCYKGDKDTAGYIGLGSPGPTGMFGRYSYDASLNPLTMGTTYYWRIDEVNGATVWKGDVWNFILQNYSNIERFEGYTATGDVAQTGLRRTWIDGRVGVGAQDWTYPNPPVPQGSSGSYAQINTDPCDGVTYRGSMAAGGTRSLKLYYDNDGAIDWLVSLNHQSSFYTYTAPKYSEVSAGLDDAALLTDDDRYLYPVDQTSLGVKRDWTGYKILKISYFADMLYNTKVTSDKLYVGLSDGSSNKAIVYCPDTDAVLHQGWHTWYILLTDFTAANPSLALDDVARIYLGVGNPTSPVTGGRGDIFIDEIQIMADAQCAPISPADVEKTSVVGDFSANCATNAEDLRYMTYAWLAEKGDTPPAPIIKLDATSGVTTTTGNKVTNWLSSATFPGSNPVLHFVDFNNNQTGYRPTLMTNVEGKTAVWFDGNDFMRADQNTPLALTGKNPWTIFVEIYRDGSQAGSFDTEYFGWTNRGDYAGAASYSTNGYGSFAGWTNDKGWTRYFPALHQWHKLAISNAGGSLGAFYAVADGKLVTVSTVNPVAGKGIQTDKYGNGLMMVIGSVYDGDAGVSTVSSGANRPRGGASTAWWLTGAISKLEVYNVGLTAGQLMWLTGDGSSPLDMNVDADNIINFKDIAIFANSWMSQSLLGG
jgi:hypothetical protein